MTSARVPQKVLSRAFNFGFSLGKAVTDIETVTEALQQHCPELALLQTARGLLHTAKRKFGENADATEAAKLVEERAAMRLE
jgi:hypothetical protein